MNDIAANSIDAAALYFACQSENDRVRDHAYHRLRQYLATRLKSPRFPVTLASNVAEEAEDCLQDAVMAIWQQLQRGVGPQKPDKFLAWAAQILANKVTDCNRLAGDRTKHRAKSHDKPNKPTLLQPSRKPIGCKRIPRRCCVSLATLYESRDDSGISLAESLADPTAINPTQAAERQELLGSILTEIFIGSPLNHGEKGVLWSGYLQEQNDDELSRHFQKAIPTIRVTRKRALDKLQSNAYLLHQVNDFFTLAFL